MFQNTILADSARDTGIILAATGNPGAKYQPITLQLEAEFKGVQKTKIQIFSDGSNQGLTSTNLLGKNSESYVVTGIALGFKILANADQKHGLTKTVYSATDANIYPFLQQCRLTFKESSVAKIEDLLLHFMGTQDASKNSQHSPNFVSLGKTLVLSGKNYMQYSLEIDTPQDVVPTDFLTGSQKGYFVLLLTGFRVINSENLSAEVQGTNDYLKSMGTKPCI